MMDDKVIVTNLSALRSKYGAAGLQKIERAVKRLISADKKRGITTRLVALDDVAGMKKLGASPVKSAGDFKQNKQAIDGVYRKLMPDYLMILGADDIVPHQNMKNPVFKHGGDEDQFAFGDLPYACEAPYSQKPQAFTGPTRVLGRLPDLHGVGDTDYLIRIIETAAQHKPLKFDDYMKYLGISAEVWRGSTEMTLTNLFGSAADLQLAPDRGPEWEDSLISRRTHFINCHGAPADSHFYGQRGRSYPQAHDASLFSGKIKEGTLVAAECCYGGELYNPNLADGQAGICNTYLGNGAYGFFGSTTIAYGPAEGNGSADLICQFFLRSVFRGASLGRAALEARQRFIESSPALDPIDLKTLAQFNLYGDPSIVAVGGAAPQTGLKRGARAGFEAAAANRADVRRQLLNKGLWLARNHPVASERVTPPAPQRGARERSAGSARSGPLEAELKRLASRINLRQPEFMTFDIDRAPEPKSMTLGFEAMRPASTAFHVIVGRTEDGAAATGSATKGRRGGKANASGFEAVAAEAPPVSSIVALVAKEVDGQIVSVRELYGKQFINRSA
jgi:hypothetical protein